MKLRVFLLLSLAVVVHVILSPGEIKRTTQDTPSGNRTAVTIDRNPLGPTSPDSLSAVGLSPDEQPPVSSKSRREMAVRAREERIAKKQRLDSESLRTQADFLGITVDEAFRQRQLFYNPAVVKAEVDAERNRQRAEDIAAGANVDLWEREHHLEQMTYRLQGGMEVASVTNLLGLPFKVEMQVVSNGTGRLIQVPLSQLETLQKPFSLIYTPHASKAHHNIGDTFRVLTISFDEHRKTTSWRYVEPGGVW